MRGTSQVEVRGVLPRIGWGLMIASLALWALLPVLPFLPFSGKVRLGAAGVILAAAEVVFWIGAAMAGPEAARRMRSWWRARPSREVRSSAVSTPRVADPSADLEDPRRKP